jgi:uncharacterized protein YgiM (DUF1202 family)
MKKLCVFLILSLAIAGFASANAMYVAVKKLPLRSDSALFADTNGTLEYGNRVIVLQTNGKFAEIRCASDSSLSGWALAANLSRTNLSNGNTLTEIENASKLHKGMNLNFADVDRIEGIPVNDFYLKMFLEEGRLSMGDNQ